MQIGFARTMTFALAAATIASNGFYLYYLVHHHMSRFWSGVNGVLLGFFMLSWSVLMMGRGGRWGALGIALIGGLNLAVGFVFFLS
jgi:hypothetical protein